ncbi:MAG: DNA polymerase III subunit delta [Endozoicomonadaceae bacterium]|nr:DNA polymerase III subunit delta [Endozoicomonadaceae bacterium]
MKLRRPDQLEGQLKAKLASFYIISGDEPLQVEESCDQIRACARQSGFTERTVYHVDNGFDWTKIVETINTLSLFAEKRLIELRVRDARFGDGKKILQACAENPPNDTIMLIITSRIDSKASKTKWFSALEQAGIWVTVWPIEHQQLPDWIARRCQRAGLKTESEAVTLLAERVEGNLLAAFQEIEKLRLLATDGNVTVDTIREVVSDNARYDTFGLVDAAMSGDARHAVRIFNGLLSEGTEPTIILWALARELRMLSHLARKICQGVRLETAMDQIARQHKAIPFILKKRKALYHRCLHKHNEQKLRTFLERASFIDEALKTGSKTCNPKDELLALTLSLSGLDILIT